MRGLDISRNWKFYKTDKIEGMHLPCCDTSDWQDVNLPHDWSIHTLCDKENGVGCTGYYLGGKAWYRKAFKTTAAMAQGKVFLQFDGIYNRSHIYCNGSLVKFQPYGYSPCLIDLSDYLNDDGEENLIAVHVDHSRYADSRWYTGSGIYRKVTLHILPKCYIPVWGTSITTRKVDKQATIDIATDIVNSTEENVCANLKFTFLNPDKEKVTTYDATLTVPAGEKITHKAEVKIPNPVLWKIYDGKQYTLQATLSVNGCLAQEKSERFGIRTFQFDKDHGFFLNGKNERIKGVCLHHEVGCVGAAVPLAVWKRRLLTLMDGGVNAIRTSHNPFSEEFIELCDDLGLLVQEEFFDEWDFPKDKRNNSQEKTVDYITRGSYEYFREFAKQDLQNVVLRDRNRACIIQWSIGNEIEWTYTKYNRVSGYFNENSNGNYFWTLPANTKEQIKANVAKIPKEMYEIGTTAKMLSTWTKEIDTTRPVIANCILPSVSYETGYADALDMMGYSYRRVIYDYGHREYPDKPIMGTENLAQWHEWKAVLERDFIAGIFLWTGADYLGEASKRGPFPIKGTRSGLIDLASFKKPSFHMLKSLWRDEPSIYIATKELEHSLYKLNENGELYEEDPDLWQRRLWDWQSVNPHWNYEEDQTIVVEIYSNCDEITLYLNDKELSTKHLNDFADHIYKWAVPFKKGQLRAVGKKNGQETTYEIMTAGDVSAINLQTDATQLTTSMDDAVHLVAQLKDANGNNIMHKDESIEFVIDGPHTLLGIDNGSVTSVHNVKGTTVETYFGKCLLILQGKDCGTIKVHVVSNGIQSNEVKITVNG